MLILTRATGESIVISDDIKFTVLEICKGEITFGVVALGGVSIFREELCARARKRLTNRKRVHRGGLLLLKRRVGDVILVGNNIEIIAVDIKKNRARIGIKAPKDTSVHRQEIYEKIHTEHKLQETHDRIEDYFRDVEQY